MLLYNITFLVGHNAVSAFKAFLDDEHLPEIKATPTIIEHRLFRLLHQDESQGLTFTAQYYFGNEGTYRQHLSVMDVALKKRLNDIFGEQVLYFCTLLEKI